MPDRKIYTLSKVTKAISKVIDEYCNKPIWIKAEIVKLNYYIQSGHCYPDLVEKVDGKVIAEIRGNIWKDTYQRVKVRFKSVVGEDLGDNMTVVFLAMVKFHSIHGLALNIIDIDPNYTLGELARQKAETIEKLKEEKIFDLNKATILAIVPKTIAIISVSTSKGYNDFIDVIDKNPWNYKFHYLLFPAVLQGERAVSTITSQLERIKKFTHVFDAVTIIRGGGGDVGLSSYNDYHLAKTIATFPIPVLTGIGHSTNETVTEMVSFRSFITPTKMGEYLIQQYHNYHVPLKEQMEKINNNIKWLFERQKSIIKESARLFSSLSSRIFDQQRTSINQVPITIANYSNSLIMNEKNELKANANTIHHSTDRFIQVQFHSIIQTINNMINANNSILANEKKNLFDCQKDITNHTPRLLEQAKLNIRLNDEKIQILSPHNILKRGYSITRLNGKAIRFYYDAEMGDQIESEVFESTIKSRIEKITRKNN